MALVLHTSASVWEPLLEPGLTLLAGTRRDLRGFCQELTHHAVHNDPGTVLWCDGDHGFDPYDLAELNLQRGFAADDGADRVLVKRCMTAFQWDTVLTKHLDAKLLEAQASLVVAAPFDRLLTHAELKDWEQEDHTRYAVRHLQGLARRHRIPILLAVDMHRWWQTHPVLAQATYQAAHHHWSIDAPGGRRWRARCRGGRIVDPGLRRRATLLDFMGPEQEAMPSAAVVTFTRPMQRTKSVAL